jgi:hypothetical protein
VRRHTTYRVPLLTLCLLVSVVGVARVSAAFARQSAAEIIGPTQQIPRAGFKTWSLFLICTPDWVTPEKSGDLANLYRRFKGFGDAIGSENLAVWFWKQRASLADARLSENVDVPCSADYCRALMLRPSEGPFLVATTAYPDLSAFPAERAVFALGGLSPADLAKLLNSLTDQLLLEGKVEAVRRAQAPPSAIAPSPSDVASAGAASAAADASGFWIRLLEGARRSMIGFGCNVKMQISTGILSAELRGCAAP